MNNQNCHSIPQFILRNFVADNKKFWSYMKSEKNLFNPRPGSVFAEKNLYHSFELDNKLNRTGERSNELEQELAKFEGRMANVYKKIKIACDEGEYLSLDEQEKFDTFKFFLVMLIRSRSFTQELREIKLPNEYKSYTDQIKQAGQAVHTSNDKLLPDIDRAVQNLLIFRYLDRPTPTPENPWVVASGNRRAKITSIAKFHLSIKSSAEPKLVIGDYPLAEIDKVNWFPISPQIAVSENWYGCEKRLELDNDFAAEFNAKIFTKSEQVAALYKKQLTALIDQDKKDS